MAQRATLREITKTNLDAVSSGRVTIKGLLYDLSSVIAESKLQTGPNDILKLLETATLDAARGAILKGDKQPIGLLNFASAEQPGGGFINGANAQEELIACCLTLYVARDANSVAVLYLAFG
ncbi:hypothetical protein B0H19DRAFT_1258499 [Mycena capillaripes]|nr:hypothetical protein B0H19DRAFT_1258499 [Mycena capillaripes]